MKKLLIVVIFLGLIQPALAETKAGLKNLRKYLCVTDATAAGVEYKASQEAWLPTIFTAGEKYIVSVDMRVKDRKTVTTVTPYGEEVPYWFCGTSVESGALLCSGKSSLFVFNERTLRFIDTFFDGYVDGVDTGLNKPYVVVGTCTKYTSRRY